MSLLIAISGGIGSGKSVVSEILRAMGYDVYDCDSRARMLMDNDVAMKERISREISGDVILADGVIDRRRLGEIVFNNRDALAVLNSIVHGAVISDIRLWVKGLGCNVAWVESAIIYESGIDRIVDQVWEVEAPPELRIERVMRRNSMTRRQVADRIASQQRVIENPHPATRVITNDGMTPLLPRINTLLSRLPL